MPSFPEIMAAQPSVFQNTTLTTLASSAGALSQAWSLYQSVSTMRGTWSGAGQTAQTGQATNLMGSGQQVITSLAQTQTTINAGAQQLQAAKTRLTALVAAAKAEGFVVLPTGQVILGPAQIAAIHAHPGLAAKFQVRMTMYNSQIQAVVFQSTAADIASGLSLAKTGVDLINAIFNKGGGAPPAAATPTMPDVNLPATSIPGATMPSNALAGLGAGAVGDSGTGLAGIGELGGAGLGLGGAGAGLGLGGLGGGVGGTGLGGAGGPGLNPGLGGPGGVAGLGAGMTAAGAAGAAGGAAGGRGASGTSSMVGYGGAGAGAAAGGSDERESRGWLLEEDADPWRADEVPDTDGGVLS